MDTHMDTHKNTAIRFARALVALHDELGHFCWDDVATRLGMKIEDFRSVFEEANALLTTEGYGFLLYASETRDQKIFRAMLDVDAQTVVLNRKDSEDSLVLRGEDIADRAGILEEEFREWASKKPKYMTWFPDGNRDYVVVTPVEMRAILNRLRDLRTLSKNPFDSPCLVEGEEVQFLEQLNLRLEEQGAPRREREDALKQTNRDYVKAFERNSVDESSKIFNITFYGRAEV